jgi:hypothetical protein
MSLDIPALPLGTSAGFLSVAPPRVFSSGVRNTAARWETGRAPLVTARAPVPSSFAAKLQATQSLTSGLRSRKEPSSWSFPQPSKVGSRVVRRDPKQARAPRTGRRNLFVRLNCFSRLWETRTNLQPRWRLGTTVARGWHDMRGAFEGLGEELQACHGAETMFT